MLVLQICGLIAAAAASVQQVQETSGDALLQIVSGVKKRGTDHQSLTADLALESDVTTADSTSDWRALILDKHNALRAQEYASGMPRLVWDAALEASAQLWAEKCTFNHSLHEAEDHSDCVGNACGQENGENIWMSSGGSADVEQAVQDWYAEKGDYTYADGVYSSTNCASGKVCRHYTQVVSAITSKVGCAVMTSCSGEYGNYIVCQYDPPGNVDGASLFKAGAACSECPIGYNCCEAGLCVGTTPAALTGTFSWDMRCAGSPNRHELNACETTELKYTKEHRQIVTMTAMERKWVTKVTLYADSSCAGHGQALNVQDVGTCESNLGSRNRFIYEGTDTMAIAPNALTTTCEGAPAPIAHVVYSEGTRAKTDNSDWISVLPGVTYKVSFEILRNDLGGRHEYVTDVVIDGQSLGECHPDGGDYDCTFFQCPFADDVMIVPQSSMVRVNVRLTGHSYDCDCDKKTWECSRERRVSGRTKMTAVGRFNLLPQSPPAQAPVASSPPSSSAPALATITHVVYSTGTRAQQDNSDRVPVVPGVTYKVSFEILRNDLGSSSEYVTDVVIDGQSLGECHPDGGDYDCTFFQCPFGDHVMIMPQSDLVNLNVRLTGHSYDCDCDMSTWECSKEKTVSGRTKMTAVGRFTLVPVNL